MVFPHSTPPVQTTSKPLSGRTILQIIPDLNAGGAERTAVDIAEGLTNAGARALVATEGGRLIGELQTKGGIWVPFPAATKNPLKMAMNIPTLVRLIKDERVDLIHARSRAPAWVALGAARLLAATADRPDYDQALGRIERFAVDIPPRLKTAAAREMATERVATMTELLAQVRRETPGDARP